MGLALPNSTQGPRGIVGDVRLEEGLSVLKGAFPVAPNAGESVLQFGGALRCCREDFARTCASG